MNPSDVCVFAFVSESKMDNGKLRVFEKLVSVVRVAIPRSQSSSREKGFQFENIMQMAQDVSQRNPTALHDLVNLVLRPFQAEALVGVIENALHQAPPGIVSSNFFFDDRKPTPLTYGVGTRLESELFQVDLSRDAIFPSPWHRHRIAGALANIGPGKTLGDWNQDANHQVTCGCRGG
jgi:hypothetical protein